ncbi:MAG: hypothetical protein AAF446_11565, partial [Pseudomonadota bacterium]
DDVGGVGLVYEISTAGALIGSWIAPNSTNSDSEGLAFDGNTGNLWLTDDGMNVVYELDAADGSQISSFAYPGSDPGGITWRNGLLYVLDVDTLEILEMDTSGTLLSIASIAAIGPRPRGITWDGSSFWIAAQSELDDEPGELFQIQVTFTSTTASTPVPALSPIALTMLLLLLGALALHAIRSRPNLSSRF